MLILQTIHQTIHVVPFNAPLDLRVSVTVATPSLCRAPVRSRVPAVPAYLMHATVPTGNYKKSDAIAIVLGGAEKKNDSRPLRCHGSNHSTHGAPPLC